MGSPLDVARREHRARPRHDTKTELRMADVLQGTVALATGAGSGIGEATARTFARRGAAVAIAARRKDRRPAGAPDPGHGGRALAIELGVGRLQPHLQ